MFEATILTDEAALSKNQFASLLPYVSSKKRARVERFRFFRDARNTLLGDLLARHEICRFTGRCNSDLQFSANEYGKPIVTNCPGLHYSISHTGFLVACVIADKPVGIDIELVKPVDMNIARRFFVADELSYVLDTDSTRRFFEVWTKKESRIKWEGKGLAKPLTSFSVFDTAASEAINYSGVLCTEDTQSHVCSAIKEELIINVLSVAELLDRLFTGDF